MRNLFSDISFDNEGHYIYVGAGKFAYNYSAREFSCSIYFINQKSFRPDFCDYLKMGKIDGVKKKTISTKYLTALEVGSVFNENGLLVWHTKDTIKNIAGGKGKSVGLPGIVAHVVTISSQNLLCKPMVLAETFPKGYFNQFVFAFLPYTYCLVMQAEINNRHLKLIIPCTEIARYFFLTGTNLGDLILGGTYNLKYEPSLNIVENEEGKRVASLKVLKAGLADAELLTLAHIYGCTAAKEAANLISSSLKCPSITRPEAYLQTSFPVEIFPKGECSSFRLEVSGFRLDASDDSPFFVTQIHNTSNFLPFDIVEWNSEVDTRSIEDKILRRSLPIVERKTRFPARDVENTGDVVSVSGEELVGSNYLLQELSLESAALGLLEETKKIDVIRLSKETQKNQYNTKLELRTENGNKFSLRGGGSQSSSYGKGYFVQSQERMNEHGWKWLNYLTDALEVLRNKYCVDVLFYNDSERSFRSERKILRRRSLDLYVVQICKDKCCFYFFEAILAGKQNPRFLAMYYSSNFSAFECEFVENLISVCEEEGGNWETAKNKFANKDLNLRRFEHQFEDKVELPILDKHERSVENAEKTASKILKEVNRLIKNLKM